MQSLRNENKNDMTHDSGCQLEPLHLGLESSCTLAQFFCQLKELQAELVLFPGACA